MSPRALGAVTAFVLAAACQRTTAPPPQPAPRSEPGSGFVELRDLDDRPALGLVQREGDPKGAVAFALAHDFGSEASLALSEVLRARLARAGFKDASVRAHGLGLIVAVLAGSPADGTRFVQVATSAIRTPIQSTERPSERARVPLLRGPAEAAVHACSGELGSAESTKLPDSAALEQWRAKLDDARAIAFAAVGPRPLLDALAIAVASGDKWGSGGGPSDRWPDSDNLGSHASGQRRLSVAYRVSDPARALEVAATLGTPGSIVATRLGALDGAFRLDRVVATTRVRGACLRVDVRAPSAETGPVEVARAIAVIDEEARFGLERAGKPGTLDEAVVRPTHPADAAGAAAWRALIGRQPGGLLRRAVSWLGPGGDELARALSALDAARDKSTLERRVRVEVGQGELWALVASPCGTAAESSDDAGLTEVLLRALAEKRSGMLGVDIEPWVTPDSVGLLAHAPRASAAENAEEHAKRVGDALGRALVATRFAGSEVAEVKTQVLAEIGPAGQRGYFAALDAASSGHPSWLDPRGTFRAVSSSLTLAADARRRLLVAGPLRLAVLANAKAEQADATGQAIERWLRPYRAEPTSCASAARSAPGPGEVAVEVGRPEHARAYVVFPIAATSREAEWAVFLLNRPGGWLEQALKSAGEARARAALLGGKHAAALLFEIQASEAERAGAVSAVRAVWQRLARAEASEADAELARRHFDGRDAERALDPRGRVVELWRGPSVPRADPASFRRFLAGLASAKEIVVHAKPKGP